MDVVLYLWCIFCSLQVAVLPVHALTCPPDYQLTGTTSCHKLHEEAITWFDASAICRDEGAMLTKTRDWLTPESLAGINAVWIGLSDLDIEGVYRWQTNEVTSRSDWLGGVPTGSDLLNCVAMNPPSGSWEDRTCTEQLPFVCEYPATYVNESRQATGECVTYTPSITETWPPCKFWKFDAFTYEEAQQLCLSRNSKMTVVDQYLLDKIPGPIMPTYWTGLKRDGAGTWRQEWDTCTPSLVRWPPSAPYMKNEDCVVADINNDQYWEVVDCTERHSVLCDDRKADLCGDNAPSLANADILGYGVTDNGIKTVTYQCDQGYVFEGRGLKRVIDANCDSCGLWDMFLPPPCVVAPPFVATTLQSTLLDTTEVSTDATTESVTTVVTTEADTTVVTTEADTTVVTTEADTTVVTTAADTTVVTTEADTTVVATAADTTVVTTEADTTVVTTAADTTVVTTAADTTGVTTAADTTAVTTAADTTVVTTAADTTVVATAADRTAVTTAADTAGVKTEADTTVASSESWKNTDSPGWTTALHTNTEMSTVSSADIPQRIVSDNELGMTSSMHNSVTSMGATSASLPSSTVFLLHITTIISRADDYKGPHCPPIATWEGATSNTSSRHPGTYVEYRCVEGRYFDSGAPYERTFCLSDGEWKNPLVGCKGENRSMFRVDPKPVEAPGAVTIGTSAIIIVTCHLLLIITLDIDTYARHFRKIRNETSCSFPCQAI